MYYKGNKEVKMGLSEHVLKPKGSEMRIYALWVIVTLYQFSC